VEFVAVFCFSYEDVYIILKKELTIRTKEKEMRNSGRRCATRCLESVVRGNEKKGLGKQAGSP